MKKIIVGFSWTFCTVAFSSFAADEPSAGITPSFFCLRSVLATSLWLAEGDLLPFSSPDAVPRPLSKPARRE